MTGSPHEHLARLLDHRRLELGMRWDEVAAAAGIKPPTLRAIRNGTNRPSALTQRGLERALSWPTGTIDAILAGQDAPPMTMAEAETMMDENERLVAEILALPPRDRQAVRAVVEALKGSAETADASNEYRR